MGKRRFGGAEDVRLPVELRLARLGHVASRAVDWLWPGRVPLGKVTLLMGDPGQGKSLVALDLAARVTRGLGWPDAAETVGSRQAAVGSEEKAGSQEPQVGSRQEAVGRRAEDSRQTAAAVGSQEGGEGSRQVAGGPRDGGDGSSRASAEEQGSFGAELAVGDSSLPTASCLLPTAPGSVVLLSAEDDAADTIRPRLEAAGGDPDRVVILRSIRRPGTGRDENLPFTLGLDLAALEAAVKGCQDARLVILDPVSAYLSGVDANSNAGLREVLAPLRDMAERTGVAVVAISHLTKRAEASVMYRALGSLAFVAAARAVWAVGPDRQAAGRLLFLPVKCNLAGGLTGLAYRIVPSAGSKEVPVIAWEPEPVMMTAAEALGPQRSPTRREEAAGWLAGVLSAGPIPCQEVERRARVAGIAWAALRRAKREMGVVAYRESFELPWMLRMPGDAGGLSEKEPGEPVATAVSWEGSDAG